MKARELAQGKWRSVLTALGIEERALDGKHHPCPASGEGTDRFRFADRNGSGNYFCDCSQGEKGGVALVMCCKGVGFLEAAKLVESVAGCAREEAQKPRRDPRIALNRIRERLRPAGTAVARYLRNRGLEVPPGLKEAKLTYWHNGERAGVFDGMVGLVSGPDGRPQSYHLTYISEGVKAPVEVPRKIMPAVETVTGGAIRLYPPAEEMGVAEGIETAIAASTLFNLPVWAAMTAGGVESFEPPPECQHLTVFGDCDANYRGQAAAYALANRVAKKGVQSLVLIPEQMGDWNDVLLAKSQREAA